MLLGMSRDSARIFKLERADDLLTYARPGNEGSAAE
jgi:hypothetical protein